MEDPGRQRMNFEGIETIWTRRSGDTVRCFLSAGTVLGLEP